MKLNVWRVLLCIVVFNFTASAQITNVMTGRVINKLLPDYLRPKVYALNQANGSVPGTLLALNPTNGAILNEISLNLNPTDMAMSPTGDALYVIHAGSRTIAKVDLTSFSVVADKGISTPSTYSTSNPLYVVATRSNTLYYTDGAWGPEIYLMDYAAGTNMIVLDTGGNQAWGAGGMVLNNTCDRMYIWQQYGWSAGYANSYITSMIVSNGSLTYSGITGPSQSRDPLNTPILLDAAQRYVFNKVQKVAATNTSVLLAQFTDNIYAISLDGTIAFGLTAVFNAQTAISLTNLPFSTAIQTLSGDQTKLFRYNAASTSIVVYDMTAIAPVSGPNIMPTPADGAIVSLPLTNLAWTVSPYALSYDVYFGTNQAQVAAATNGSAQFLGRVTTLSVPLSQTLFPGSNYFWRVDVVGFSSTNAGTVWSFTNATIALNPTLLNVSSVAGYSPASVSLSVTGSASVAWTAKVTGSSWMTLSPTNGTTPSNPTVSFNTLGLVAGTYTNNIEFTASGLKLQVPVTLTVKALNISKMAADPQRPYIYALQPPTLSGQNGLLLFINTTNGNIDKALPIGINPTDLTVHRTEGRLYIASWTEGSTYVVDLNTQTLLPSLLLGTDVYKINAGRSGRIVTEGEDQWITVSLINTTNGSTITTGFFRQGDGAFDPTGRYYYHGDDNISGAGITKYDMNADTFASVASAGGHYYYGSRNVVMSQDGSRLFWTSAAYDANLTDLGTFGAEIYSCSTNGTIAFSDTKAFDTTTRLAIYNLPVTSSISVVDGQNQRFWYFNTANSTLGSIPISAIQSPSITVQPAANTSVTVSNSVYLTVTAMGLSPLSYQWTCYGTNLASQTNYFLSIPSIQFSQTGDYQVIVSNPYGSVTSAVAHVTVLVPPSIVSQSASTNVLAGRPFTLSVVPGGTAPFTYRWMFENTTISGATSASLTINNAQTANEGIYRVAVNNSVGSVTSAPISVRVLQASPLITTNPASVIAAASSNATFTVTAIGSQPFSYRWYFNNQFLGATANPLTLSGIQSSNAGDYFVIVSNSLGSATSSVATLTVTALKPYFTTQPAGASVSAGSSRTFTGLANGSQPITYQWQRESTNLPGATTTSLTLTNVSLADSGAYTLIASNIAGVSTSAVAQLTVYQTPTVAQGLTNQVVDAGSTVTLSVNVLGSPTLGYVWQLNGVSIPGSNATLTISNIQPQQSGYYKVTVTNGFGSATSTGRVSVLGPNASVVAWGDNSGGQTNVPNANDLVAASGGDYHSVALHHDGTLLAWGYNGDGQTSVPTNVLRFVSIASGANHNLAIKEDGGLVAWGRNDYGQCTIPSTASNLVCAVAAGDSHSMALLSSGTVVAWGDNSLGQTSVPGMTGVTAIAAGRSHNLALRTNGTVTAWGFNAYGQTSVPANLTNVMAISAGYLHSVALLSNGTVRVWGDNSFGQTNVPANVSNIVAIAAGDFHTIAMRTDGTLVAWGDDSYGELDYPAGLTNLVGIASGNYHGLALIPTGNALTMSLKSSGLVIGWKGTGTLQSAPTPTGPWTDVTCQPNCYTNVDMTAPAKFFRLKP